MEKSIFYRLTSEDENATTELLCNLCLYEEYKNIILDALELKGFSISFDDINTQLSIPNRTKIPDIVIENEKIKIYIENKIDRGYKLNHSQTKIYPQNLENSNKNVKLIYLVPKAYKDIESIKAVMEKYNFASLIYWEDLIDKLSVFNKNKCSEILNESIIYFNKILKTIPKTNFTMEDLLFMNNIEIFRKEVNTMAKELELFYNVLDKLKKNLGLRYGQKEPILYCCEDQFGYSFCMEQASIGYSFGWLDSDKNEEKECVLNLCFCKDFVNENIKTFSKYPYVFENGDDGGYYFFRLDPNILANNDREKLLLEFCENIFNEVINI